MYTVKTHQEINKDGIIVYLDADCTVENNYFHAISDFFTKKKRSPLKIPKKSTHDLCAICLIEPQYQSHQ